jgi:hypothetical protein
MRSLVGVAIIAAAMVVGAGPVAAAPVCGAPEVRVQDGVIDEGGEFISFLVTASVATGCQVSGEIEYSTDDFGATDPHRATPLDDYLPVQNGTLHLTAAEQEIKIRVLDDDKDEGSERFGLAVVGGTGVDILTKAAVGWITDDDKGVSKEPEYWILGDGICWEPDEVLITVVLDRAAAVDTTIHLRTHDGSAIGGLDFDAIRDRTLTIPAGASSVSTTVKVFEDHVAEQDENFVVEIFNPATGTVIDATAEVTIKSAE